MEMKNEKKMLDKNVSEKLYKAYGSLSKYANKKVASEERDIIAKAMVEKYVKNN